MEEGDKEYTTKVIVGSLVLIIGLGIGKVILVIMEVWK